MYCVTHAYINLCFCDSVSQMSMNVRRHLASVHRHAPIQWAATTVCVTLAISYRWISVHVMVNFFIFPVFTLKVISYILSMELCWLGLYYIFYSCRRVAYLQRTGFERHLKFQIKKSFNRVILNIINPILEEILSSRIQYSVRSLLFIRHWRMCKPGA